MLTLVLSFLMSFALVYAISPVAIRIAHDKGLVADPIARSSHKKSTPIVGGIPIFIGILFTTLLLTPHDEWKELQFILSAVVIVFMVGTKDDIESLSPLSKIGGLVIAIAILVSRGGVELQGMYGLFGMSNTFPTWACMVISGFTLLVITNAFNLIDGINGLAGTVGSICSITFGIWFFMVGEFYLGVLSMTTAGSLLAFLRFNMTPAKTFMGDTGSLVLGLLLGIMAVKFIDIGYSGEFPSKYRFDNPIAVAVGILIVPLFDTIRVFTTRALRGQSPLKPDRSHIHHLLIDAGYSHMEGSAILGIFNMLFISMVFYLDGKMSLHYLLGLEVGLALLLTYFLYRFARRSTTGVAAQPAVPEVNQPS